MSQQKTTQIKIRNFKAKLPIGCMEIISVDTTKPYTILAGEMIFSGNYSKNYLLRWVQKNLEYILPKKITIVYL